MRDSLTMLAPQVAYLATFDKRTPYTIIAAINLVGGIFASFLPETLGCNLPETILTAAEFGKEQKYFSWMWNPQTAKVKHENEYTKSVKRKSIRLQASMRSQRSTRLQAPLADEENV